MLFFLIRSQFVYICVFCSISICMLCGGLCISKCVPQVPRVNSTSRTWVVQKSPSWQVDNEDECSDEDEDEDDGDVEEDCEENKRCFDTNWAESTPGSAQNLRAFRVDEVEEIGGAQQSKLNCGVASNFRFLHTLQKPTVVVNHNVRVTTRSG